MTTPKTNSNRTANGMAKNGERPVASEKTNTAYIATTISAPCAKLMTSITPKIIVSPPAQ